jgi:hypothetical protein
MNEKLARALVADLLRKGLSSGTIEVHDDENVYTVTVSATRVLQKYLRESRGLFVSSGAAGSVCPTCNGSGRI